MARVSKRIYASYEDNANRVHIIRGRKTAEGTGKFREFDGAVAIDSSLARTYKGRPIFRLREGSAEALPWLNGNGHHTILTADRYDEAVSNNYVQQIMERLNPRTLESVRNWIMFACVLGIIVFQFWLYNEAQKDLETIKFQLQTLQSSLAAEGGDKVVTV